MPRRNVVGFRIQGFLLDMGGVGCKTRHSGNAGVARGSRVGDDGVENFGDTIRRNGDISAEGLGVRGG